MGVEITNWTFKDMNNSIDSRLDSGIQSLADHSKTAPEKVQGKDVSSQSASGNKPADQLDLTAKAQSLKALEEHIQQAPETDNKRIAELKQALKDGTYEINPSRIAEKLLALDGKLPE